MANNLGRWALILGASSGFGAATSRALAQAGYNIFGVHLDRKSTMPVVEALQDDIRAAGGEAVFFNMNAADETKRREAVAAMRAHLGPNGAIPGPLRHGNGGFQLPARGVTLPVRSDVGTVIGRFVLDPTPGHGVARSDRELAVLVTSLIAPSLTAQPTSIEHRTPGSAGRTPT